MTKQEKIESKHQRKNRQDQGNQQLKKQQQPEFKDEIEANSIPKCDGDISSKKKIIRKFPFTSGLGKGTKNEDNKKTQEEDELKDWRPRSISSGKNLINSNKNQHSSTAKSNQIADQFLSFLPKPTTSVKQHSSTFQQLQIASINPLYSMRKNPLKNPFSNKPSLLLKPTQQQLKWDGQDQFLNMKFQVKMQKNKNYGNGQLNATITQEKQQLRLIDSNEDEVIEKIQWINQKQTKSKNNKHDNLAQIIDQTWQKQTFTVEDDQQDRGKYHNKNNNNRLL